MMTCSIQVDQIHDQDGAQRETYSCEEILTHSFFKDYHGLNRLTETQANNNNEDTTSNIIDLKGILKPIYSLLFKFFVRNK